MLQDAPEFRFRGEFNHVLDDKGRLAVPNRFREELKKSEDPNHLIVHYRHDDGCLAFYPVERWKMVEQSAMTLETPHARDLFIRYYLAPAEDVFPDKAGRILIPAKLRGQADLNKEVVVLGSIFKFEIWDKVRFMKNQEEMAGEARELLKRYNILL